MLPMNKNTTTVNTGNQPRTPTRWSSVNPAGGARVVLKDRTSETKAQVWLKKSYVHLFGSISQEMSVLKQIYAEKDENAGPYLEILINRCKFDNLQEKQDEKQ